MAGLASLLGGILQVERTRGRRVFCVLCVTESCVFIKAAISIFGIIGGPLLGLFTLGIICPFVNFKVSPFFGLYGPFYYFIAI